MDADSAISEIQDRILEDAGQDEIGQPFPELDHSVELTKLRQALGDATELLRLELCDHCGQLLSNETPAKSACRDDHFNRHTTIKNYEKLLRSSL